MQLRDLRKEVDALPVVDVHSHIRWNKMGADSLQDVILYHMMRYLYRAADSADPHLFDARNEEAASLDAAIEKFPEVSSTSFGRMLGIILRELYGVDGQLTAASLPELQSAFGKTAEDSAWGLDVLKRTGIVRMLTSRIRDVPSPDAATHKMGVRFTIESSLTSGTEEHLAIRDRVAFVEKARKTRIRSAADLQRVTDEFYGGFDWNGKRALVAWMGARADFTPVDAGTVDTIIADAMNGVPDTPRATALFQAAVIRCMCSFVKKTAGIFQLVYGTQTQGHGFSRHVCGAGTEFASTLGSLFAEYPDVHFNILNGYEPDEPTLCSLCTAYPNVSLAGFWWHAFYPSVMHAAWHRRLEMVPVTRLCGFFSDGWCAEWTYARLAVVREVLTRVLAEKVESGFYSLGQALDVARRLLLDTPAKLFLPGEGIA